MYRFLTTAACILGLVSTGHAQMCKYKLPNGDTKIAQMVARYRAPNVFRATADGQKTRKKKRRASPVRNRVQRGG